MTVEELTALDLGYAPPYSPVWDPVLVAACQAAAAVGAAISTGPLERTCRTGTEYLLLACSMISCRSQADRSRGWWRSR